MRRVIYYLLLLAFAIICETACRMEIRETDHYIEAITLRAYSPGGGNSKTTLEADGKVAWVPNDAIKVFSGNLSAQFTTKNTKDTTLVADFTGILNRIDEKITALYPYSADASYSDGIISFNVPDMQNASKGTFASNLFPAIAESDNEELHFKNVCGGVKFTVSRDDVQFVEITALNHSAPLAGDVSVIFDEYGFPVVKEVKNPRYHVAVLPPSGECFVPGVNYYIVLLPGVLSDGFSLDFYTNGQMHAKYSHASSVEVLRSSFSRLYALDDKVQFKDMEYVDLSAKGEANCYIVSKPGNYKFSINDGLATVGATNASLSSAYAEWQTFNDKVTPTDIDIVRLISVKDKYIYFSTPEEIIDGNALIGVKDNSGDTRWSWHIWACDKYNPIQKQQKYYNGAGIFMDRNLGATSATPGDVHSFGLLYQWGRHTPFVGAESSNSSTQARATRNWTRSTSGYTAKDVEKYQCNVFIYLDSSSYPYNYVWTKTTNSSFWNSNKGTYDPCPPGWKVADRDFLGTARGSGKLYECFDSGNDGFNFTNVAGDSEIIWYPCCPYIDNTGANFFISPYIRLWTNLYYDSKNSYYYYVESSSNGSSSYGNTFCCLPVRCQRMVSAGDSDNEDTDENDWL